MPTCRASELLLHVQRWILSGKAVHLSQPWLCSTLSCDCFVQLQYLHLWGPGAGPLFLFQDGFPLSRSRLLSFLQSSFQAAGPLVIALELELPLLQTRKAALIIPSRHWVVGCTMHLLYVCTPLVTILSVAARLS